MFQNNYEIVLDKVSDICYNKDKIRKEGEIKMENTDLYLVVKISEGYEGEIISEDFMVIPKELAERRYNQLGFSWYAIDKNGNTHLRKDYDVLVGDYWYLFISSSNYYSYISAFNTVNFNPKTIKEKLIENTSESNIPKIIKMIQKAIKTNTEQTIKYFDIELQQEITVKIEKRKGI